MLWLGMAVTLVAGIATLLVVVLAKREQVWAWLTNEGYDFVLLGTFCPPTDTRESAWASRIADSLCENVFAGCRIFRTHVAAHRSMLSSRSLLSSLGTTSRLAVFLLDAVLKQRNTCADRPTR
jgi:hypothetical protein